MIFKNLFQNAEQFYATGVPIKWYFYLFENDQPKLYEQSGLYDIITQQGFEVKIISNPKTKINNYYNIYKTIRFTNNQNSSFFSVCTNRIISINYSNDILHLEFKIHPSITKYFFDYKLPLVSCSLDITWEKQSIQKLYDLILQDLILQNDEYKPRCELCDGLKGINGIANLDDDYDSKFLICFDCIEVANQFFDTLLKDIYSIKDWEEMLKRRSELIQLANSGKVFAININDDKLLGFYDSLIILINYLSAAIDFEGASRLLVKIQRDANKKGYKSLEEYSKLLRESFSTINPEESIKNYNPPSVPQLEDEVTHESEINIETPINQVQNLEKTLESQELNEKLQTNQVQTQPISQSIESDIQDIDIFNKFQVDPNLPFVTATLKDMIKILNIHKKNISKDKCKLFSICEEKII